MEWIKCSDRLPKHNEQVGYVYDGEKIRRNVHYYGFNGSWETENSLGFYVEVPYVTHWMLYPDKPKD